MTFLNIFLPNVWANQQKKKKCDKKTIEHFSFLAMSLFWLESNTWY